MASRCRSQLCDPAHLAPALAILFTVPGVPCVYYGDEFAWLGTKEHRVGGDDAIRPALAPDAEPVDEDQGWVLGLHRELIALRSARGWLTVADLDVVAVDNHRITFTVTSGKHTLLVALDLSTTTVSPPAGWQPLLANAGFAVCEPA